MQKRTSTTLIIPTLNEAETIAQVLSEVPSQWIGEVIVVDGGSTDGTATIAEDYGARVLHEGQRGYGRACAKGLADARCEVVIFMDADGADDPKHIPHLLAPILNDEFDMVLGSRLAGQIARGAMLWHQRLGNKLSAKMISRLYGIPLTDLSPFRSAVRDKLLTLDLQDMTYGYPTEMIVKAIRQGWRICEIPVDYRMRAGGKSKISGTLRGTVGATYHILATILRYARE